jgi:hypothetical protein
MKAAIMVAAVAALQIAIGPATAQTVDLPPRKPGLWQITMTMPGAKAPPRDLQMCIDAASDAQMAKFGMTASQGMCSKNEMHRSGDTFTTDAQCHFGQKESVTHSVTKFSGDTAYHTEVTSLSDKSAPPRLIMTQDARWSGPCPADMHPGDVVMPGGMKMNLNAMAKGQ